MSKHWFPLESNPEVMTLYAGKLGLDVSSNGLWFHDVMSTEEWALAMVPQPVLGVLMLFPIKEQSEEYSQQQQDKILKDGQAVSPNLYFMKQTVGNACGTVGVMHAIINAKSNALTRITPGSFLDTFVASSEAMTSEERAQHLNNDESIETFHEEAATEGQSTVVNEVDSHFICFSCVDGALYELDGRKAFPVNHGPCHPDELLVKACGAVQEFMARDPGELGFTIVALAKAGELQDD